MDGGDDAASGMYQVLLDRLQSLEAGHQKLKDQLSSLSEENPVSDKDSILQEKETASDSGDVMSFPGWSSALGEFVFGSPYRSILEYMGHAVHVSRADSGEIIYWNYAAEKLFDYKDHEVIGQRVVELLFDEANQPSAVEIMERLNTGESWSGQFPLKKRSGQIFMAMVTKNPLYEDGELVGVVTVLSDAAVFNSTNLGNMRPYLNHDNKQSKVRGMNVKKIQWHPSTQIAAVPPLASSVSNLASKVRFRKWSDPSGSGTMTDEAEGQDSRADRPPKVPTGKPAFSLSFGKTRNEATSTQKTEPAFELPQPSKLVAKVFSKFHKGDATSQPKNTEQNIGKNSSPDTSMETAAHFCKIDSSNHLEDSPRKTTNRLVNSCCEAGDQFSRLNTPLSERDSIGSNKKTLEAEDASPRRSDSHTFPSTGDSYGSSHGSSSSRGGTDSHKFKDCPIRWEDLKLMDEVGHGSFGVVYRGVWNGSDVAVKVFSGNQCSEQTLIDYKKEIDIMRRLRHPNVLLFMGAVCSEEKLAIVTEYMTRGSLFKTLHRNNQSVDMRRRLRIATDVARGMNYLHHRNPPIVHRDLKSSNLLVDKNWTVKVGDFGLSKLKDATFLTAKSGRGTPQWMAPEVLRNEPSTEKSDIFSFGVILWELMTESIPWRDLNALQVVGIVGFMDRRLDLPTNMDPRVSSIILDCWRSKPEARPSFEDIIPRMTNLLNTTNVPTTTRMSSIP